MPVTVALIIIRSQSKNNMVRGHNGAVSVCLNFTNGNPGHQL